jgi:hypothetical protein
MICAVFPDGTCGAWPVSMYLEDLDSLLWAFALSGAVELWCEP